MALPIFRITAKMAFCIDKHVYNIYNAYGSGSVLKEREVIQTI